MPRFLLLCMVILITCSCGSPTPAQLTSMSWQKLSPGTAMTSSTLPDNTVRVDITPFTHHGSGQIDIQSAWMPKHLSVTLGLPQLARLQLSYGDRVIIGSVKPGAPYHVTEHVRLGTTIATQGRTILADSPYWMHIQAIEWDGSVPSIPLREGYFEIDVPQDVYQGAYHHLLFEWFEIEPAAG